MPGRLRQTQGLLNLLHPPPAPSGGGLFSVFTMFARKPHRNPQPTPERRGSIARLMQRAFGRPAPTEPPPPPPEPVRIADVDPVMRELDAEVAALRRARRGGVREIDRKRRERMHAILAGAHR